MPGDRAKIGEAYVEIKAETGQTAAKLDETKQRLSEVTDASRETAASVGRTSDSFKTAQRSINDMLRPLRIIPVTLAAVAASVFAVKRGVDAMARAFGDGGLAADRFWAALSQGGATSAEQVDAIRDNIAALTVELSNAENKFLSSFPLFGGRSRKTIEEDLERNKANLDFTTRLAGKQAENAKASEDKAKAERDAAAAEALTLQLMEDGERFRQEIAEADKRRTEEWFEREKQRQEELRKTAEIIARNNEAIAASVRDATDSMRAQSRALSESITVSMGRMVQVAEQIKSRMPR